MRISTTFIALLACCLCSSLSAQIPGIEARFWYFGTGTDGLEFNGAPISSTVVPAKLTNKQSGVGFEGMIVVNDPVTGALLFYSDGSSVVQANHTTMNNGSGLMGHFSGAQTVHCVPDPASLGRFFLITKTSFDFTPGSLYTTTVDFTNASFPMGTVPAATKNVLIDNTGFSQGSSIASKPGTQDYWWIGHVFNTNTYHVRAITAAGMGPATTYTFPALPVGEVYAMAYSGTAQKVAAGGSLGLVLFDFDPMTGILSNASLVSTASAGLGNFSPNGSKLYAGMIAGGNYRLHQYDLSNGVLTNMNTCCYAHDTKVAPNGKMYHIHTYYSNAPIAVIDFPDLSAVGNACGYNASAGIVGTFNGESRRFPEFVTLPFVPLATPGFGYMRAQRADGQVSLAWELAGCAGQCRFQVERNVDGQFRTLADVVLTGDGHFSYLDAAPLSQASAYRIAWIDGDGRKTFSNMATVGPLDPGAASFTLSPNPSQGQLHLHVVGADRVHLEVIDLLGRTLLRHADWPAEQPLDVSGLSPGHYLLRLTMDGRAATQRFERVAD